MGPRPLNVLVVVDNAEDAFIQPDVADGLRGLLSKVRHSTAEGMAGARVVSHDIAQRYPLSHFPLTDGRTDGRTDARTDAQKDIHVAAVRGPPGYFLGWEGGVVAVVCCSPTVPN